MIFFCFQFSSPWIPKTWNTKYTNNVCLKYFLNVFSKLFCCFYRLTVSTASVTFVTTTTPIKGIPRTTWRTFIPITIRPGKNHTGFLHPKSNPWIPLYYFVVLMSLCLWKVQNLNINKKNIMNFLPSLQKDRLYIWLTIFNCRF
jgi:hypothetical protein